MKKILITLSMLLFLLPITMQAQLRKIPASVTEAFNKKYPAAGHVSWKDKIVSFAAVFEINDTTCEARFNSDGNWEQTEITIGEEQIPAAVRDGLNKSKYADWKATEWYRLELPKDSLQYRIVVAKNDIQKKNLLFNNEGRLLSDKITF